MSLSVTAALKLLKTLVFANHVLRAKLPDPFVRSIGQFGMVLVLPRPGCIAKSFALTADHDLATGNLREKRASATLAD
jgi:hypothetical protein